MCVFSLSTLKDSTPVSWKGFSFFRKFISKFKYWKLKFENKIKVFKISRDCHIKIGQSLKRKYLVPIFKRIYAVTVGFKMKPPGKSIFLCYDKNQLKFCCKTCWKGASFHLLPAGIYMLKVNNRNTRTSVSIVNFEHVIAGYVHLMNQIKYLYSCDNGMYRT